MCQHCVTVCRARLRLCWLVIMRVFFNQLRRFKLIEQRYTHTHFCSSSTGTNEHEHADDEDDGDDDAGRRWTFILIFLDSFVFNDFNWSVVRSWTARKKKSWPKLIHSWFSLALTNWLERGILYRIQSSLIQPFSDTGMYHVCKLQLTSSDQKITGSNNYYY